MTLEEFQAFVAENHDHFAGRIRETANSVQAVEQSLGTPLPRTMTWLLTTKGYSAACGVPSLTTAVSDTLRCRESMQLPERYVILDDMGDAGVVLLDTGEGTDPERWPVLWMATHNVYRLAAGKAVDADCDRYEGFGNWVQAELDRLAD